MSRLRLPLWAALALLAAVGVVGMHTAHLVVGNRLSTRALALQQELLGRNAARLIADQAADLVIVKDRVSLHELVTKVVSEQPGGITYCLVVHHGHVLASSFDGPVPPGLVHLRDGGEREPLVVRSGEGRTLDLVEPILGGELGEVRLGVDLRILASTRRTLATQLGLLSLGLIGLGAVAAVVAGRLLARPLSALAGATEVFDPEGHTPAVAARGVREVATVAQAFNRMASRLQAAHAEQQRARQKALETERLAALGAVVAGVAHEVNNPLAGMKNCLRRLERPELPEPKRREYLSLMDESLQRLEVIMRRLLDFGRPQPPQLRPWPLRQLADEAVAFLQPVLEERHIQAAVLPGGGADDGALVLADRRMVGQALVNLLLNAVHVTPAGGAIRLELRARGPLRGIAVADAGPGIPPAIRDRVLDPFFSTKPEGQGTGLGLSVTRSIVDAHAGDLTFEFPDAGGTVVTVWMPEAAAAAAPLPPRGASAA